MHCLLKTTLTALLLCFISGISAAEQAQIAELRAHIKKIVKNKGGKLPPHIENQPMKMAPAVTRWSAQEQIAQEQEKYENQRRERKLKQIRQELRSVPKPKNMHLAPIQIAGQNPQHKVREESLAALRQRAKERAHAKARKRPKLKEIDVLQGALIAPEAGSSAS